MVNYNTMKARKETLNYLRHPVPRTPISIVRHLKSELEDFYPNTNGYRVVSRLKETVIEDLLDKNVVIKYTEEDDVWRTARELLNKEYESMNKSKPRKLTDLYQINFFYLSPETQIYNLPVLKDINLNLTAMFYRFLENKKVKNYFWNVLNLFYCYYNDENRGKIRVKIHGRQFSEKESRILDRALNHAEEFEELFEGFPFQPDPEEAIIFLERLQEER